MRKIIIIIGILLLTGLVTNAQPSDLFTDSSRRDSPSLDNIMGATRARYAEIDFTALAQTDLTLNLFNDIRYTATHVRTEARPSGEAGYVWIGTIPDQKFSDVVLVVTPTGIFGQINTLYRNFAVELPQPQLAVITEVNGMAQQAALKDDGLQLPESGLLPSSSARIGNPIGTNADSGDYIDIMVIYTAAAAATEPEEGSIIAKIDSMIAVTNNTYRLSGVHHRLRLKHIAPTDYVEEEASWVTLRRAIYLQGETDPSGNPHDPDGAMDEVHALRDQYYADLVMVISKEPTFGLCGSGTIPSSFDLEDIDLIQRFGYAVTDVRCWSPGYTYAHETGHNMGGAHDHANSVGFSATLDYGYGYQDPGQEFVTIMAYTFNGNCPPIEQAHWYLCVHIGRWSSPEQTYNNKPLGSTTPQTNMVLALNTAASFIANYRLGTLGTFDLIAPSEDATVTDPALVFEWQDVTDATRYKLKITTASGYNFNTEILDVDACDGTTCQFSMADATGWKPPYNQKLKWQITASDDTGRSSLSAKQVLIADFLPKPVTVSLPAVEATVSTLTIPFTWENDVRVDQFRLKVNNPDGAAVFNTWLSAADICDATTCTYELDLTTLSQKAKAGNYQWRVQARRDETTGKTKSPLSSFKLKPSLTLISPDDSATLPDNNFQFTWEEHPDFSDYRLRYLVGGTVNSGDWSSAETVCVDGTCTLPSILPVGQSKWWIEARTDNYTGKAKSEKRLIVVGG